MVPHHRATDIGICSNCLLLRVSHDRDHTRRTPTLPRQAQHGRIELLTCHRHLRAQARVGPEMPAITLLGVSKLVCATSSSMVLSFSWPMPVTTGTDASQTNRTSE
jgi:hypothetical protein